MSLLVALWLQADDLGTKTQAHTPGSESGFSRVMVALFVIGLVVAVGVAGYMVYRGCRGALFSKKGKS